jgi:hypothetical protein
MSLSFASGSVMSEQSIDHLIEEIQKLLGGELWSR